LEELFFVSLTLSFSKVDDIFYAKLYCYIIPIVFFINYNVLISARWSRIVYPAGVSAGWSKKWQSCFRKTTSLKNGHQKNTPPETTLFAPFFPIFMTFYISQHYGRHVTTSLLRRPEHKGNPAKLGGRTPKK
jgi:hypothetical protein